MNNVYWPIYINLETVVSDIAFSIHIDDEQLGVYSSRIADAILRAAIELESIAKNLYQSNGGTETGNFKFDEVALRYLRKKWMLDKKHVIISSPLCFQTNRVIIPFVKDEIHTGSSNGRYTFGWNNAYQCLKHDRANAIRLGNIKHLFDIMAALYLLNIYYKDEKIELGKDSSSVGFPATLGSKLFSVVVASCTGRKGHEIIKPPEFETASYYIDSTPESSKVFQESLDAFNEKLQELFATHPKRIAYLENNDIRSYHGQNLAWDVLGKDEYIRLFQRAGSVVPLKADQLMYHAVVNKHAI